VDSDADAAESPRRALADGRICWAETAEAASAAPKIVVVNAEVVRRKPRLLALLRIALPDGSTRLGLELKSGRSLPVFWHEAARTGLISRMAAIIERWSRDSLREQLARRRVAIHSTTW